MRDFTHGPRPGFWRLWWAMTGPTPMVLFFIGFVSTALGGSLVLQSTPFETRGVIVQSEVVGHRIERMRQDERWETIYFVTFRYSFGAEVFSAEVFVRPDTYDKMVESSNHEIRLLQDDPSQFEVNVGENSAAGQWILRIGLVLFIAGLVVQWWTSARVRNALGARESGQIEIVRVEGVGSDSDSYWLRWREPSGAFNNSMSSSSLQRYEAYPIGTEIEVYRDRKGKTWWVGDVGPRKTATNVPSVGKT